MCYIKINNNIIFYFIINVYIIIVCNIQEGNAATIINFDDQMSAPCLFVDQPIILSNEYASLPGTPIFQGTWKVLDQCGRFNVVGHSSPNFLAWNINITGKEEIINFTTNAVSTFEMDIGSGFRQKDFVISALNKNGTVKNTQTISTSSNNNVYHVVFSNMGNIYGIQIQVPPGTIGIVDNIQYTIQDNSGGGADPHYVGFDGKKIDIVHDRAFHGKYVLILSHPMIQIYQRMEFVANALWINETHIAIASKNNNHIEDTLFNIHYTTALNNQFILKEFLNHNNNVNNSNHYHYQKLLSKYEEPSLYNLSIFINQAKKNQYSFHLRYFDFKVVVVHNVV